ncbi:MAG TPA: RAMP superfamily CRISPR-associated protein, partial [Thermogutta sp.]|nr:RAMP superfamily CRISPR-associated protein [Thermogutta sp.]
MSNSLNGRSAATLFLHAQTGLHPGTGTALGVVDLPVQRERHTQWPTIAASALKGILRDVCREKAKADFPNGETLSPRRWANERHQKLVAAFGPGIPE